MKRKQQRTLERIFQRPTSGNIPWKDIESLFKALGAEVSERSGSRVAVYFLVKFGYFTGHTPPQTLLKEPLPVSGNG